MCRTRALGRDKLQALKQKVPLLAASCRGFEAKLAVPAAPALLEKQVNRAQDAVCSPVAIQVAEDAAGSQLAACRQRLLRRSLLCNAVVAAHDAPILASQQQRQTPARAGVRGPQRGRGGCPKRKQ